MEEKYLKNRHFTEIRNGVQNDIAVNGELPILDSDPKWLVEAKQTFNHIVSEDYFAITIDYDNKSWMMTMA